MGLGKKCLCSILLTGVGLWAQGAGMEGPLAGKETVVYDKAGALFGPVAKWTFMTREPK
jgi:hypothetical protein